MSGSGSPYGGCGPVYGGSYFDQSRTVLAGVPRATLLLWQVQLQTAMFNAAIGQQPLSLSYTQGDGVKSVSHNIASQMAAQKMLELVNRCLGLPPVRRPMRVFFR